MNIKTILIAILFVVLPVYAHQESIRRLDAHIRYLRSLHSQYRTDAPKQSYDEKEYGNYGYFKNPRVVACIKEIFRKKSLMPFFDLWDAVKKESHSDEALLEECTLLTVVFFNNILDGISGNSPAHSKYDETKEKPAKEQEKEITIEEIMALYNRLAAMPLMRLIELLDGLVKHVSETMKTSSTFGNIFKWMNVPWWEPVLVIGVFIYHWVTYKIEMREAAPLSM
jgi:hypothetical protein